MNIFTVHGTSTAGLLAVLLFVMSFAQLHSQTITIEEARSQSLNSTVQIEGIVINTPNERDLRFIQDSTAGIAVYAADATFNQNVRKGDRIQLRGKLDRFQGLLEISEIYDYELLETNVILPPVQNFNRQILASRVQLECLRDVNFAPESVWEEGSGDLIWNEENFEAWIPSGSSLAGSAKEDEVLQSEGIVYEDDNGYHLLMQDISYSYQENCLFWKSRPQLSNAGIDFLIFDSELSGMGQIRAIIREEGQIPDTLTFSSDSIFHTMVDPLSPATLYQIEWQAFNANDTLVSPSVWYATQSLSSKEIDVFFNHPLLEDISNSHQYYTRGIDLVNEIIERIDGARESVDVALYNFNNADIKAALENAHNRGIRVRCLADGDNSNIGFRNTDLNVYRMAYGSPLMHNKFIVVDADIPDNAWFFMGGTNLTPGQIFDDPNSALGIKDQMLARVYEKEFEELWGSGDDNFDPDQAKQGNKKEDNTPHFMFMGTQVVESYFSPSDGTTQAIYNALATAEQEVYFSLLTFTKNELRDMLITLHERGVEVKGIIENVNDNGGEFYRLNNEGIEVLDDTRSRIHHHKYAVIDPNTDNAKLIVGSHNWTQKAEDTNDENILILHDRELAAIFTSEFFGRWCEYRAENAICQNDSTVQGESPLLTLSPNPAFANEAGLFLEGEEERDFQVEILDAVGKSKLQITLNLHKGYNHIPEFHKLVPGLYFLSITSQEYEEVLRMIIAE